MNLKEFIMSHNVDYSYNRANEAFLPKMESLLGVRIGKQLKDYIINYGYLGYNHIELFGVNNSQGIESDMIKQTLLLHKQFDVTRNLIAIEDQGDGDYYLVDETDMVYRFLPENNLYETGLSFYEYILSRFMIV